ncbi:uncharacterized protein LOC115276591 [Suricata suricatta]|uniref:uncharacterized protein LOC115276591 n=1 Tax=Suricata suricatta TaxID=37032 RepID=UPI001155A265|nr:uncharacterized protein LOC115276591 [Suricata suricatta]
MACVSLQPPSSATQTQASAHLLPVSTDSPFLAISCQWSHTYVLLFGGNIDASPSWFLAGNRMYLRWERSKWSLWGPSQAKELHVLPETAGSPQQPPAAPPQTQISWFYSCKELDSTNNRASRKLDPSPVKPPDENPVLVGTLPAALGEPSSASSGSAVSLQCLQEAFFHMGQTSVLPCVNSRKEIGKCMSLPVASTSVPGATGDRCTASPREVESRMTTTEGRNFADDSPGHGREAPWRKTLVQTVFSRSGAAPSDRACRRDRAVLRLCRPGPVSFWKSWVKRPTGLFFFCDGLGSTGTPLEQERPWLLSLGLAVGSKAPLSSGPGCLQQVRSCRPPAAFATHGKARRDAAVASRHRKLKVFAYVFGIGGRLE